MRVCAVVLPEGEFIGDGAYPVLADFDEHGRITRVTVDFDPQEVEALP